MVGMAMAFSPSSRLGVRSLKMAATAADVVSQTTLATMARDARGLAIDSISAVSALASLYCASIGLYTVSEKLDLNQSTMIRRRIIIVAISLTHTSFPISLTFCTYHIRIIVTQYYY